MKAKKLLKIVSLTIGSLLALCIILLLLAKFVFREQLLDYLQAMQHQERLATLRSAAPYDDEAVGIHFNYRQDSLQADSLFRYFRLDTLVSHKVSTWENTLAIARFVTREIPHANNCTVPEEERNALGLWKLHLEEEKALNCYYHSVMLHELLNATGITNRYVRCMPADSTDRDCHVVNLVWLPEHRKWAMVDSDQGAYLTDSEGTPLSLAEMRQRLTDESPVQTHFFPGKQRKDYLSYWTKNLYWFNCYEDFGFNQDILQEGRYLALVPPGYPGFQLREGTVVTSNPEEFWAAPEAQ